MIELAVYNPHVLRTEFEARHLQELENVHWEGRHRRRKAEIVNKNYGEVPASGSLPASNSGIPDADFFFLRLLRFFFEGACSSPSLRGGPSRFSRGVDLCGDEEESFSDGEFVFGV